MLNPFQDIAHHMGQKKLLWEFWASISHKLRIRKFIFHSFQNIAQLFGPKTQFGYFRGFWDLCMSLTGTGPVIVLKFHFFFCKSKNIYITYTRFYRNTITRLIEVFCFHYIWDGLIQHFFSDGSRNIVQLFIAKIVNPIKSNSCLFLQYGGRFF